MVPSTSDKDPSEQCGEVLVPNQDESFRVLVDDSSFPTPGRVLGALLISGLFSGLLSRVVEEKDGGGVAVP